MSVSAEMLPLLFFTVALVYSSVGFAGGSSYLLVLTLAGFSHTQSSPVALVCNLLVSAIGIFNFQRARAIRWKLVLPFAVFSVPMAFVGAKIPINKPFFFLILGISLAIAACRLLLARCDFEKKKPEPQRLWTIGGAAGGFIGLVSGLLGIGGGIFLSPFLILSRWASVKEASAAACVFIFINSLSSFIGKLQLGFVLPEGWQALALAAVLGGWIGSRLCSAQNLPKIYFQRGLAVLLLYLSVNFIGKGF